MLLVLGLCSWFWCAHSVAACSGAPQGPIVVKTPSMLSYLFSQSLWQCIHKSDTPAIGNGSYTTNVELYNLQRILGLMFALFCYPD